jgi:membrane protease YdiL (CAAX protease family)
MDATEKRAVKPWQAIVAFFTGGVVAQLLGAVAAVAAVVIPAVASGELETSGMPKLRFTFGVLAAATLPVGGTLVLVSLLVPRLAKVPVRDALGLARPRLSLVVAASVGAVALMPLGGMIAEAMQRLAPGLSLGSLETIESVITSTPIWALLPVMALSAGVAEELFFRGLFQRAFGHGVKAVVLSGIAFASFHIDPHHVLAVLPVGFYLAWVAARASSTWVSVVAHVAYNATAIVLQKASPGDASEEAAWPLVVGGLVVAAATAVPFVRAARPGAPDT